MKVARASVEGEEVLALSAAVEAAVFSLALAALSALEVLVELALAHPLAVKAAPALVSAARRIKLRRVIVRVIKDVRFTRTTLSCAGLRVFCTLKLRVNFKSRGGTKRSKALVKIPTYALRVPFLRHSFRE